LAAVSASSTNLAFGAVLIGDSNDRSVTLTSTGTAPLTISGTAIQGVGAGMYAITSNTYSGSLAAGATCTIDVTFNPTSIGAHPASLSITTNASAAPLVVTLSGNGTKKAAKEGSDKLISIEKVNENQMSVARQAREGVLPPANALASAASAPAATSQAFIQPAERPVVGAEPASPAEAQTPAAKPVEGPKKG
jgi:hypothetical protein